MALNRKSPHVMAGTISEGLPPHDHGRDRLFINNPRSDTTGGTGRHPELPVKGVQARRATNLHRSGARHRCTKLLWLSYCLVLLWLLSLSLLLLLLFGITFIYPNPVQQVYPSRERDTVDRQMS
jgi:hypothetical protein